LKQIPEKRWKSTNALAQNEKNWVLSIYLRDQCQAKLRKFLE
jgi:hypothetical protein